MEFLKVQARYDVRFSHSARKCPSLVITAMEESKGCE